MNKHLIVIGIVVMLLVVGLSGCNEISNPLSSEEDRFIGTWNSGTYNALTFFSDGTGSESSISFQWEIKDGKLVREMFQGKSSIVYDYQFSDNDTSLTLTDVTGGTAHIYTKQQ